MISNAISKLDNNDVDKQYPYLHIDWITNSEKQHLFNKYSRVKSIYEEFNYINNALESEEVKQELFLFDEDDIDSSIDEDSESIFNLEDIFGTNSNIEDITEDLTNTYSETIDIPTEEIASTVEPLNINSIIQELISDKMLVSIYCDNEYIGKSEINGNLYKNLNRFFERDWKLHLDERTVIDFNHRFIEENILLMIIMEEENNGL